MASTFKYNVGRGDDILLSSSASLRYGADAVGAVGSAYNNLVEDGDWEGALEDVANLLPYIGEINKQLKEHGLKVSDFKLNQTIIKQIISN